MHPTERACHICKHRRRVGYQEALEPIGPFLDEIYHILKALFRISYISISSLTHGFSIVNGKNLMELKMASYDK